MRTTRNRLLCFLLSVFVVLFLHAASLYNITYTPSVLAMRFLPPLLLLLALTYLPQGRRINAGTAVAIGLCAIWSLEALAFGGLAYVAYIFILGVADRRKGWKYPVLAMAWLVGVIVLPHVLLSVGYLVFLGTVPRYDIYWELLQSQSTGQANWMLPINPDIRTWMLFGFSYALGLAYAMFGAWRAKETGRDSASLAFIGALCMLGIVQFSYYIGRSATPVLVFLAFPLAILFIYVLDRIWSSFPGASSGSNPYRIVGVLGLIVLIGMGGVFADRFFRPISPMMSNSTILRSCLASWEARNCSLRKIVLNIRQKIQEPVGFPVNEAGGWSTNQENREAYGLIRKFQGDEAKVLLFITDSAVVLFLTKKENQLGFAHSMVDGLSPTLVARARRALDSISEGSVVIIGDTTRSQADQELLAELRKRWAFCWLESRETVTAYRLERKTSHVCAQLDER